MAVRTREEIMESIRNRIGDDTSDEALAFIEDVSDTLDSMANSDKENWKQKYEENDAQWRQRYRDRFYNSDTPEDSEEEEEDKPLTFDGLFKKED